MKKETNKSFKLTAMLLSLALLFPFTSEALHLFSHDGHEHCTDTSTTHFHQHNFECEIFDFNLTPVFSIQEIPLKPAITANFKTIFPPVEESFLDKVYFQIKLRGPPQSA